jgi:shikimate dehydrogenase
MTLTGAGRVAGVMGWPVKHSRSPRLHGYWLRQYDIDGAYVPMAVAPADLGGAIKALRWLGFAGANVTVPLKEAALQHVDLLDPLARRIGAVNTIVVREDGRLEGSNTDAFGFLANLEATAPTWVPEAAPAAILGAGGAARAVLAALLDAGVPSIRIANRTRARGELLAAEFGGAITVLDWGDWRSLLDGAGLLVNTTTLGMAGQKPLDIVLDHLPQSAVVNDIVYVPLETGLLATARHRGNQVVDGLGMLLHQARPGFRAWFGVDPEVTPALRAHVAADLL